jgi:hypothetical protein
MSTSRIFPSDSGSSGGSAWDAVANAFVHSVEKQSTDRPASERQPERTSDIDELHEPRQTDEPRQQRRRRVAAESQFTGPLTPLQIKLPADMVASLKLLAFDENVTVQSLVLRYLTTAEIVPRCWLQRRNAG